MLKPLIIILLLLTPTALPATGEVCRMMMNHLDGREGEMSCCPANGSGGCPMMRPGHSAPAQAEMTEADSAPEPDPAGIAVCNCGMSNSSIPPGLPSDRLTATDSKVSPDAPPSIADWHPLQSVSTKHRTRDSQTILSHLHQTCLRI
ncbi:MAG TPA: hypothetical protein VFD58_22935 [Blastocatellia bacterium]|nr:hypothetical protein [Blastocatellia bacterium]